MDNSFCLSHLTLLKPTDISTVTTITLLSPVRKQRLRGMTLIGTEMHGLEAAELGFGHVSVMPKSVHLIAMLMQSS